MAYKSNKNTKVQAFYQNNAFRFSVYQLEPQGNFCGDLELIAFGERIMSTALTHYTKLICPQA